MAGLVVVLSVIIGLAQAIPAPGHGILAGYCKTSIDCGVGECCVSFTQPRGKRFVTWPDLSPDLMRLVDGYCHKLAAKNDTCIMPGGLMPANRGVWYDCPCADGLECVSTGTMVINKGEGGVCKDSPSKRTATQQPCHDGSDCADTECCVSNIRPIGKRQFGGGHCKPMGTSGSSCFVNQKSGKPTTAVYACPCSTGLICNGTGMFDIPLGEIGKCGA